ncbi:MAG: type VI secretion system baseplate subunit TssF [Shimia sp.]
MWEAFKRHYDRELHILRQRGAEFAREHGAMAGLLDRVRDGGGDPSVKLLLEGTAFLAARVQMQQDEQFRDFTSELLERLMPDLAAPMPAATLLRMSAGPNVRTRSLPRGETFTASLRTGTSRIGVPMRLADPVDLWPLEVVDARYETDLAALPIETPHPRTQAAFVMGLTRRASRRDAGGLSALVADGPDGPGLRTLPIHFLGASALALFGHLALDTVRIGLTWTDARSHAPKGTVLSEDDVSVPGLDPTHPLASRTPHAFPGHTLLSETFAMPWRFLGLTLGNLDRHLAGVDAARVDLVVETSRALPDLPRDVEPALHCVAATGLKAGAAEVIATDDRKEHRWRLTPKGGDRAHYAIHDVRHLEAAIGAEGGRVEVLPVHAPAPRDRMGTGADADGPGASTAWRYALQRQAHSRVPGAPSGSGADAAGNGHGTATWVTLSRPPGTSSRDRLAALRAEVDLAVTGGLGQIDAGTEFKAETDTGIKARPASDLVPWRPPLAQHGQHDPHGAGRHGVGADAWWRLLSAAMMGYRSLTGLDGTGDVVALKDTLRLFASDATPLLGRDGIDQLIGLATRPETRMLHDGGLLPVRGLAIDLTFTDTALRDGRAGLLGVVLDRVLAHYAHVNSFTHCRILNDRGEMRRAFPPRSGSGPLL